MGRKAIEKRDNQLIINIDEIEREATGTDADKIE